MNNSSTYLLTTRLSVALTVVVAFCTTSYADLFVDFEELTLSPESFYNGSDDAGGFFSQGLFFNNTFTDFGDGVTGWEGWSYSNRTDNTTPGFSNQYSAFPGFGADESANYAVGFNTNPGKSTIVLPSSETIQSIKITNTTYAALSMQHGDAFAKKFGGDSGDDPDFLKLTVTGRQGGPEGKVLGNIDSYLADFRFMDNSQDFILDEWVTVDLSSLFGSDTLTFAIESTDVGTFGINTPTYFALDDIRTTVVPEPQGFLLILVAVSFGLVEVWRHIPLYKMDK